MVYGCMDVWLGLCVTGVKSGSHSTSKISRRSIGSSQVCVRNRVYETLPTAEEYSYTYMKNIENVEQV